MLEIKLSTIEFYFSLILIISTGIQLFYYIFFYSRVFIVKRKVKNEEVNTPISVIICAKNEEDNLKKNLPLVLAQKYKTFEVIVVNDCSVDDSEILLSQLQEKHTNLRFTSIKEDPKFKHNKKLAITVGIKAAKYNHFAFIDADCYPTSDHWLQNISNEFANNKSIVLGYGGYIEKETFFDKLVRVDTFNIGVQYLSFAHAGIPYMGVGRNMAYTRKSYEQSSKFTKHYHIKSGDDDLFIAEVANKKNTSIVLSKESITRSEQVENFKIWKSQKLRHLSTSSCYSFFHKILLVLEPFTRLLFYTLGILYFILGYNQFQIAVISLIGSRFFMQILINKLNMIRLHEKKLLVYSLLFDIVLPIILFMLHLQNKLNKRKLK